jgi:hypothetical protein
VQIFFERDSDVDGFLHLRVVEAQGVASGLLALIHGDIGLPHQLFCCLLITVKQGDADGGRAAVFKGGKLVSLVEYSHNFLGDIFCLTGRFKPVATQIFQHHHEFIAAQPRHAVVRTDAGLQSLRNLLQQDVADVMAEGIINSLEIIKVKEQDRP